VCEVALIGSSLYVGWMRSTLGYNNYSLSLRPFKVSKEDMELDGYLLRKINATSSWTNSYLGGGGAMVVIRGRYGVYNNSGVIMGREEGR
jgi:hypothetical protein